MPDSHFSHPPEGSGEVGESYTVSLSTSGRTSPRNDRGNAGSRSQEQLLERPVHGITDSEHLREYEVESPGLQEELYSVVDLDGGAGMSGYAGKMSSASWLRHVHEYLATSTSKGHSDFGVNRLSTHTMDAACLSYFMDDENLLAVNEDDVEPVWLPQWPAAMILIAAYFHSLHGAFCWVQCTELVDELRAIYSVAASGHTISWAQRKHLALANMVWAVGAKWLHLTVLDQPTTAFDTPVSENHLVYYARARALGLDHRMQLDHPTMTLIQGMAVLSFYLMVNGSVQRAWILVGQAIRHAIAIGLHLKVAPKIVSSLEARDRARLWYSLFRLEITLSELSGRPKCLRQSEATVSVSTLLFEGGTADGEEDSTEELPLENDDRLPELDAVAILKEALGLDENVARLFSGGIIPWSDFGLAAVDMTQLQRVAAIELSQISDKVGDWLYLSSTDPTWAEVQETVHGLQLELRNWQEALPPALRLKSIGRAGTDSRSNLGLELHLCSIRMLLYRPFLSAVTGEESSRSAQFNLASARTCVRTAMNVTEVLPDDPVAHQVLQILPWYSLLHYICQTGSVLLLEMCLEHQHMRKGEKKNVMAAMRKTLQYARILSPASKSAYKLWSIMRLFLDRIVSRSSYDGPQEATQQAVKPRDWTPADEESLQSSVVNVL